MSATPTPSGSGAPSGSNTPSRFHSVSAQPTTIEDILKQETVGLVHLSEFKKRRAELLEQKEREAAGAAGIIGAAVEKEGEGPVERLVEL